MFIKSFVAHLEKNDLGELLLLWLLEGLKECYKPTNHLRVFIKTHFFNRTCDNCMRKKVCSLTNLTPWAMILKFFKSFEKLGSFLVLFKILETSWDYKKMGIWEYLQSLVKSIITFFMWVPFGILLLNSH